MKRVVRSFLVPALALFLSPAWLWTLSPSAQAFDFDLDAEFEDEFDFESDDWIDQLQTPEPDPVALPSIEDPSPTEATPPTQATQPPVEEDPFDLFEDLGVERIADQPDSFPAPEEDLFDLFEEFDSEAQAEQMTTDPLQEPDILFDPLSPEEDFAADSIWDEFFPEAAPVEETFLVTPEAPPFQPEPDFTVEPDPSLAFEPEFPQPAPQPDPWAGFGLDESPDYALEARLHQIFVNYNSRRVSEEDWSLLLAGREVEVYEIQRGDTLWGVSTTFFGDGNYWPKIWSVNAEITNPHLIRPGHSIRFILGDMADAPAFAITETELEDPDMSTLVGPIVDADGEDFYGVEIPPPLEVSRPVVRRLPPSLPVWDYTTAPEGYDETGVDYIRRDDIELDMNLPLPAFILESAPESIGRVFELELGGEQVGLYQYCYVEVQSGLAKPGDRLTVVRPLERLRAPNSEVSLGLFPPKLIETGGVVELVDVVESRAVSSGRDMFRAIVVSSVNPILPGSLLISGPVPRGNFSPRGQLSEVEAQIVGGVNDRRSHYFATHSIVFLNRGRSHGLVDNSVLAIRANPRARHGQSIVRERDRRIGQLKVLKASENFATALVLSSSEGVYSGDFIGGDTGLMDAGLTAPRAEDQMFDDFDIGPDAARAYQEDQESFGFDDFNGFDDFDAFDDFDSMDF